ncbi:MAG TPA: heme exporter protein CcmD [Alphaproteobacteria bacterium]|nr:heme exporter protein CcmD [Alphaproteobacteria bacterium]
MPNWLSHPNALYVVVAYGVAFGALIGLLFFSWQRARQYRKLWRALQERRGD